MSDKKEKKQKMSNKISSNEGKQSDKNNQQNDNFSEEIKEIFSSVLTNISSLKIQLTALTSQIKIAEKRVHKKMKQLDKELKRNKNKGNRQPSGFAKPTKISPALCKFMELPEGSEMARTEVTKYIIQYIQNNKLQNPTDAKLIKPNNELKSLLDLNDNDGDLTYFNIQRFMNKHFVKS
jgi:chromatin remodeling complex protein RSC6